MAQTQLLINTLKKQLKLKDKTYADVALCLGLSEASVKRLFAEQNFTLQRLERICDMLELEFAELVAQMTQDLQRISQLSEAQEREIANDVLLLLITVCVINGYRFQDIVQHYRITETQCVQKLAQLDRLKIIELLPNNRIKLRISANFSWLPNGPIQQFFHTRVQQDFFNSRFDKEHEKLLVINGLLSRQSNREFQKKLQRLVNEFDQINRDEAQLPIEERYGTTVVLAMREWQYSLFEQMSKE